MCSSDLHVKLEGFSPEKFGCSEDDGKIDFPHGDDRFSGLDTMESGFCGREVLERYVHLADGRRKDKVETASAVHEHPAHVESSDLGIEHQRRVSRTRNAEWVIGSVE